eukprot:scaffold7041_cov44-Phaeocystis_antarctica.AAC.1
MKYGFKCSTLSGCTPLSARTRRVRETPEVCGVCGVSRTRRVRAESGVHPDKVEHLKPYFMRNERNFKQKVHINPGPSPGTGGELEKRPYCVSCEI